MVLRYRRYILATSIIIATGTLPIFTSSITIEFFLLRVEFLSLLDFLRNLIFDDRFNTLLDFIPDFFEFLRDQQILFSLFLLSLLFFGDLFDHHNWLFFFLAFRLRFVVFLSKFISCVCTARSTLCSSSGSSSSCWGYYCFLSWLLLLLFHWSLRNIIDITS